jgi:tRNA pseudouridine38-40 synthase
LRNIRVVVEYEGTGYHGFAIQKNLRTVQGELERAVASVTGARSRVIGAGRTGAGAHAMGQVASFKTESRLPPADLIRALNANLADDILVRNAEEVQDDFHPRWSARRRHYRYSLWNGPVPNLWKRRYRHHVPDPLDLEAMGQAARCLVGTRDFSCFTFGLGDYLRSGARRTTVRTLFEAYWHGAGPELDFEVFGTAFLPHMIRNMVGSMIRVGLGKMTPQEFQDLLEKRSNELSTWKVPALGLMLVGVEY